MYTQCIFISHLRVSILPDYHQGASVTEYVCLKMCMSNRQALVSIMFMLQVLKSFTFVKNMVCHVYWCACCSVYG